MKKNMIWKVCAGLLFVLIAALLIQVFSAPAEKAVLAEILPVEKNENNECTFQVSLSLGKQDSENVEQVGVIVKTENGQEQIVFADDNANLLPATKEEDSSYSVTFSTASENFDTPVVVQPYVKYKDENEATIFEDAFGVAPSQTQAGVTLAPTYYSATGSQTLPTNVATKYTANA